MKPVTLTTSRQQWERGGGGNIRKFAYLITEKRSDNLQLELDGSVDNTLPRNRIQL